MQQQDAPPEYEPPPSAQEKEILKKIDLPQVQVVVDQPPEPQVNKKFDPESPETSFMYHCCRPKKLPTKISRKFGRRMKFMRLALVRCHG